MYENSISVPSNQVNTIKDSKHNQNNNWFSGYNFLVDIITQLLNGIIIKIIIDINKLTIHNLLGIARKI